MSCVIQTSGFNAKLALHWSEQFVANEISVSDCSYSTIHSGYADLCSITAFEATTLKLSGPTSAKEVVSDNPLKPDSD